VKPVQDSVAEALQLWKTVPDVDNSPALICTGDAQAMNGSQLKKIPNQECPVDRAPWMNDPVSAQDSEQTSWDAGVPATSPDSSSGSYDEAAVSAGAGSDWAMVCHQFQNMVHQQ
jgi:hypothetical protein